MCHSAVKCGSHKCNVASHRSAEHCFFPVSWKQNSSKRLKKWRAKFNPIKWWRNRTHHLLDACHYHEQHENAAADKVAGRHPVRKKKMMMMVHKLCEIVCISKRATSKHRKCAEQMLMCPSPLKYPTLFVEHSKVHAICVWFMAFSGGRKCAIFQIIIARVFYEKGFQRLHEHISADRSTPIETLFALHWWPQIILMKIPK